MADTKKYRFLRVLEYIGSAERLAEAKECRAVKGTQHFDKDLTIYEGILGDAASPVTGQMRLKLLQMIVKAADEMPLSPGQYTPDYREGYEAACQELLAMIEFTPSEEQHNG